MANLQPHHLDYQGEDEALAQVIANADDMIRELYELAGTGSSTSSGGAPAAHATTHEPGGTDTMAVNAAAGTGSLRTLSTTATSACAGNDSRLSDARTPTAHATTHKSGGTDPIKLDEFAATTDVATLNSSTTAHGLMPKLDNNAGHFYNGVGTQTQVGLTTGVTGVLPAANIGVHATSHQAGGGDPLVAEVTVTTTGNIVDLNIGTTPFVLLRMNNASLATIQGMISGCPNQQVTIESMNARVDLSHQDTGEGTAGRRLINPITSGVMPLAPASGRAVYVYDSTTARWRQSAYNQGNPISATYNSAYYGASSGTWTVDSADVENFKFVLLADGYVFLWVYITATSISATPARLDIDLSAVGPYTIAGSLNASTGWIYDNGTPRDGLVQTFGGGTASFTNTIGILRMDLGSWAIATNLSQVRFVFPCPIT